MRKLVLAAALSGTMLTLAACSGAADETTDAADTAEIDSWDESDSAMWPDARMPSRPC